jgi:hypothetical protein
MISIFLTDLKKNCIQFKYLYTFVYMNQQIKNYAQD